MAVDTSGTRTRGNVYYAWHSGAGSAPSSSFPVGIWFRRSTDGGASWSQPRLMSTLTHDAILPALSVDPITGEVVMTWLDRRDDPANTDARLYAARSFDGGETWDAPQPLSAPFTLDNSLAFLGHYNANASYGGTHLATFADGGGYMSVARFTSSPANAPPRRRAVRH
jgi:Neuraminidase (sialidase)